ncbi:exostosin, partial [Tribonema minus]
MFTVRMNTFRRNDDLKRSVDNYALCPAVTRIQIVWSDQENEPPPLNFFSPAARELIEFELHTTDSLNNRFNALSPPPTEGVFSVDDDMLFKCEDLKFAHQTWRAASETMVGFVPRLVTRDEETGEHRYRSWWFTWWNGAYNLVLTKAAFLHRKHLDAYMTLPPKMLAYVDAHRNCEDIAMSMVVARDTRAPPLWVRGAIRELGAPGISSSGGHYRARCACLDAFAQVLGGTHLQLGTAKAVP